MHRDRAVGNRYLVAHPGAELYGSDRVMLESVAGMIEAGAEVVVTLPESGPLVPELERLGALVEVAPALVLRKSLLRPRNWGASVADTVRGLRTARRLLRAHDPDAVYVSTVTLPLWPLAARLSRVPTLVHLHEGEQGASSLVKKVLYTPVRWAREIVVNSEFSRGVLAQAFPALAQRAHVVYNGVPGPAHRTPARRVPSPPLRLVYIGRLSPRKGPDLIVQALTVLPATLGPIELDLVGDVFTGYEWFHEQLIAQIAAAGLQDRVRLLGFRPSVWESVDAADIVVIPSRLDEPFGNTAVEGVLAGRIVLVSDTSGLREATEGFCTAIRFRPDDAAAIAAAVTDAVTRWPQLVEALEDEAQSAAERFSPARYRADIAARMAALTRSR